MSLLDGLVDREIVAEIVGADDDSAK